MLRKQLLAWLLLPLLLLLAVDTFISYWVALRFSQRAYDRALVEIARDISLHLKSTPEGGVTLDLSADARDILLGDLTDRIFFEVTSNAGEPLAGEVIPGPPPGSTGAEVFYEGTLRELGVRIVQIAVESDSQARPGAVVRVAETEVKRHRLAREILLSVVLPQALLIALALAMVWIGVLRGLAPLERLRVRVAERSRTDWSPIVANDMPGEVLPLLAATNNLLSRLDDALTIQNRFIADAAHQLKTPVAVLKTQLELAMREDDPARMREALEAATLGHERISRVVQQLLSLARNEPEANRAVVLAPLDLNALALEVASTWVPEAFKRGIDLGLEGAPGPVMVNGDAARLRELLDNLVDNAVRYSREGGVVTMRVLGKPAPVVEVTDDGPSIPMHDRQLIFERFHRVLGSPAGGSGLGLAIAREIARIHGATIDLQDDSDGIGNVFSVTFPAR